MIHLTIELNGQDDSLKAVLQDRLANIVNNFVGEAFVTIRIHDAGSSMMMSGIEDEDLKYEFHSITDEVLMQYLSSKNDLGFA